jgi:hypothetical protein
MPLLCAAGLAACSQPFDSAEDPAPGSGTDGPLLPAFYLVQPGDLTGQSINGQPVPDLTQYGFLVCNPGLDPDAVRAAAPQAMVFGYVSSHWVPLWGQNTTFWDSLRARFDSTDFWVDGSGRRASTWLNTEELLYTAENAAKMADHALQDLGGFDGIYIDDCFGSLAATILRDLPVPQSDWPQVEQDWDVYLEALVQAIDAGTSRPIVGNAGVTAIDLRHLPIQGFASEEWWPTYHDVIVAEFSIYDPRYCVAWEFDAGPVARAGDIRYR